MSIARGSCILHVRQHHAQCSPHALQRKQEPSSGNGLRGQSVLHTAQAGPQPCLRSTGPYTRCSSKPPLAHAMRRHNTLPAPQNMDSGTRLAGTQACHHLLNPSRKHLSRSHGVTTVLPANGVNEMTHTRLPGQRPSVASRITPAICSEPTANQKPPQQTRNRHA